MATGRVIAAILLSLLAAGVSGNPESGGPYLRQGWSQEQRQEFYHKSQGTRLIPLPWLLALTQKDSPEPFLADTNIAKFRFIPDPKHKFNAYGLPVGFAVTDVPISDKASEKIPWVGLTCAGCHTGQIVASGKTIVIDGAPSMQNNLAFVKAMLEALGDMVTDDRKLETFAMAALGIAAPSLQHKEAIKAKVTELV